MPWFKNIVTGVAYELEGERTLDIARGNTDLEELNGEPETIFGEAGSTKGIKINIKPAKIKEDIVGQPEAPLEPAEPAEPEAPTEPEGPDALDELDKPQLIELAKSLNIATSGKNMDALKAAIRSAE